MEEHVAVITGGATGIGRAVADALISSGCRVVIAGRTDPGPVAGAAFVPTDVRRERDVAALFEFVDKSHGRIDYLFNNAGIEGALCPIDQYPEQSIDDVLATNLKGVFLGIKYAGPRMAAKGRGAIINTASTIGTIVPFPDGALYGSAKAAILSLTRSAAAAFGPAGVRVNAVCPWITDTPMVDRLTGHQAGVKAQFGAMNPSGAIVSAADAAAVMVGIATGAIGLANGGAIVVDRGGATSPMPTEAA